MKTLTKTKLTVKTAVGIAIIGGAALAAGFFINRYSFNPDPVIQPDVQYPQNQQVTAGGIYHDAAGLTKPQDQQQATAGATQQGGLVLVKPQNQTATATAGQYGGNFAGKNITGVDNICAKLALDNYAGPRFLEGTSACFTDTAKDKANFPNSTVPYAYVGLNQANNNSYVASHANSICCDTSKYFSTAERASCAELTKNKYGINSKKTLALTCSEQNKIYACYRSVTPKEIAGTLPDGTWYRQEQGQWVYQKAPYLEANSTACANSADACRSVGIACPIFTKQDFTFNTGHDCDYWLNNDSEAKTAFDKCQAKNAKGYYLDSLCVAYSDGAVRKGLGDDADGCLTFNTPAAQKCTVDNNGNSLAKFYNLCSFAVVKKNVIEGKKVEMSCTSIAKTASFKTAVAKCISYNKNETDPLAKYSSICVRKDGNLTTSNSVVIQGGESSNQGKYGCISEYSGSYFCLKQDASGIPTDSNNKVCYFNAAGNYVTESQQ